MLISAAAPSEAALITYKSTNLADVVSGQDLWSYEFAVSDYVFEANQGFSLYFGAALFRSLQSPAQQVSPDWDILTFQPDPLLPAVGVYDALALVNGATLVPAFRLTVTWLGGPNLLPGPLAFTINQFDMAGNVSVLETGQTTPAAPASVPEPSTLLLMACVTSLAMWQARARRRPQSRAG